jgi:ferredoxin
MNTPSVELSACSRCGVCVSVCPAAFRFNAAGYIEIIPLLSYPEPEIEEAIRNCPERCIFWEEERMDARTG